jgi:hypothetical protein
MFVLNNSEFIPIENSPKNSDSGKLKAVRYPHLQTIKQLKWFLSAQSWETGSKRTLEALLPESPRAALAPVPAPRHVPSVMCPVIIVSTSSPSSSPLSFRHRRRRHILIFHVTTDSAPSSPSTIRPVIAQQSSSWSCHYELLRRPHHAGGVFVLGSIKPVERFTLLAPCAALNVGISAPEPHLPGDCGSEESRRSSSRDGAPPPGRCRLGKFYVVTIAEPLFRRSRHQALRVRGSASAVAARRGVCGQARPAQLSG